MTPRVRTGATLVLVLVALAGTLADAQAPADVGDLRVRLRARYDIAVLRDGVAFIPRERDADLRLIEVRDGAVVINGEEVTARELRDRVGRDAELLLRVTYLDAAAQQQLAAPDGVPSPAVSATPATPATPGTPAQPARSPRPVRVEGERVRVMGSLTVAPDEIIEGDVVVVMGSARIDGEVDGDVTVVMGSLALGPTAFVHKDVNVIGGAITRAPGARVDGAINNVGLGGSAAMPGNVREVVRGAFISRIGGLAATLVRVGLVMLLALVVVAFGPELVTRIADRTAADPVRAGLVGLFAELLFVPVLIMAVVALAVSIIGIPLLVLVPFGVVLALGVLLVGFTGVAHQIGRLLHARAGWTDRGAYASVALGVLAIAACTVLARSAALIGGNMLGLPLAAIGYVIEYAAWTIGCGAAIQAWQQGRRRPWRAPAAPPPA